MGYSYCVPKFIGKINGLYFEWSTVVDAPMAYNMTLPELQAYIKEEYGRDGLSELPARLKLVEQFGLSSRYDCKQILAQMTKWLISERAKVNR